MTTTLVTVTYSNRWELLRKTLEGAQAAGIGRAVVVANGVPYDIASNILGCFGPWVSTVQHGSNLGSAAGYATGIKHAIETGSEFLLLLDDDNLIDSAAVRALSETLATSAKGVGLDKCAALAYRADHVPSVRNVPSREAASFFGFDFRDIPRKVMRRLSSFGSGESHERQLDINVAPYGGLFFHTSVIDRIGLPKTEYVLYGDDNEFSHRIKALGGRIVLSPTAVVRDLELSWGVKRNYRSTFHQLLLSDSEKRLYYSLRNNSHFERHVRSPNSVARELNKMIYVTLLYTLALAWRRMSRFELILSAIRDGEQGRLGIDPRFPL